MQKVSKFKYSVKYFLTWFLFTPIAILNGSARNYLYQPLMSELLAHQISTITGSILFLSYIYLTLNKNIKSLTYKQTLYLGVFFVFLTIIFEFVFGHYVVGHSWEHLLYDYNLFKGRIWALFLLSSFFTPTLVKKLSMLN